MPRGTRSNVTSREVLAAAVKEGWYDTPKRTSIRGLAAIFNLSKSALARHLNAAEALAADEYLKNHPEEAKV